MRKLVGVLSILMSALASVPIHAEDGSRGTFNGGGERREPLPPSEVARNALKSQFAAGYYAHRKAGGTLANFKGGLATLEVALNGGESFGAVSPTSYPAPYEWNILSPASYQAQQNGWYCGPASAWVALRQQGAGNNHYGAGLSQDNVATSYWLNTHCNNTTTCTNPAGTGRGANWTKTLNGWTSGVYDRGWYVVHDYYGYVDAADVASKFTVNIDAGYAPIMNVHMSRARGWLPGWRPGEDIHHYVPGYGYSQFGDFLNYIEVFSAATVGYKSTTKEQFATLLGGKGMIW